MNSVAVIGSGISGLSISNLLSKSFDVTVIEKDNKPGGLIMCDIIDGNLFRSYIEIPNSVPVGQYKVNLYLIIDNKISNEYSYNFMVTRVGIEEAIYSFSKNYPLVYGLISLLIAILIGLSGAEVFKRFRKV